MLMDAAPRHISMVRNGSPLTRAQRRRGTPAMPSAVCATRWTTRVRLQQGVISEPWGTVTTGSVPTFVLTGELQQQSVVVASAVTSATLILAAAPNGHALTVIAPGYERQVTLRSDECAKKITGSVRLKRLGLPLNPAHGGTIYAYVSATQ